MSEKWDQFKVERQMHDFEKSMPGSTKHERKILKRAEAFLRTLGKWEQSGDATEMVKEVHK